MKKYIYLLILTLLLQSCKDTAVVQQKIQKENKKYFNSAFAAKILFDASSKYFQYGTWLYPRPKSKLTRYVELTTDRTKVREVTKRQLERISKRGMQPYQYIYTSNSKIDAVITQVHQYIQYFNEKNKKSYFQIRNNKIDIDATTSYVTSCNSFGQDCSTNVYSEPYQETDNHRLSLVVVNKIFKDYTKYYKGKETIHDSQNRMIKQINYADKKVKYYFYKQRNRYEVVCDYRRKKCEIKHNCDNNHKYGEGGCGLVELEN